MAVNDAQYILRYINDAGGFISLNVNDPSAIRTRGLGSDNGGIPFDPIIEETLDGSKGRVSSTKKTRGTFSVAIVVRNDSGLDWYNQQDSIIDAMADTLPTGKPNEGYLEIDRIKRNLVDYWRVRCTPKAPTFPRNPGETFDLIFMELHFTLLEYYETRALTADQKVLKAVTDTWQNYSFSEHPSGNARTQPIIYLDAPATGTINIVTIENTTTNELFQLTNLGLVSGSNPLVIDSINKTAKLANGTSVIHRVVQGSKWPTLLPMINDLSVRTDLSHVGGLRISYRTKRTGIGL